MAAWFSLLGVRAEQSSEKLRPAEMIYLCPAVGEVAVATALAGAPETDELQDWRVLLEPVRRHTGREHSSQAQSTTVVIGCCSCGSDRQTRWRKTGGKVLRPFATVLTSPTCLKKAEAVHKLVVEVLGDAAWPDIPEEVEIPVKQLDARICVFHAANNAEEAFGARRGEGAYWVVAR